VDNKCICVPGYTGIACENSDCSNNCSNNGVLSMESVTVSKALLKKIAIYLLAQIHAHIMVNVLMAFVFVRRVFQATSLPQ
jgi:hypothetical protein